MKIVVCIKQIIDPEIPTEQFKLDPVSKRQVRGGLSLVISAYDQNALEVALQLREKAGGKITALSLGEPEAQGAVKSAMGMGLDAGVLVTIRPLQGRTPSAWRTSWRRPFGRSASRSGPDGMRLGGHGQQDGRAAPGGGAGMPCLSFVSRIEARDGMVVARRIVEDGYELVEAPLPLVASILSDDSNVPRYSQAQGHHGGGTQDRSGLEGRRSGRGPGAGRTRPDGGWRCVTSAFRTATRAVSW